MRRAVAIQLIINRELGLNKNQNPWQGSFFIEQLTDLVEEAVYKEFEAISERGGVLGAMETMYQRGKIQEESLYYETQEARRHAADHRRQHVPVGQRCVAGAQGRAADPLDGGGEAGSGGGGARIPGAQRGRVGRGAQAPADRSRRRAATCSPS